MKASEVQPTFVDLKRASARVSLSVKTLRRAIDNGDLPSFHPTRKTLVRVEDLDLYIETHKIQPQSSARKSVNKKVTRSAVVTSGQQRTENRNR
jgi:hypothetical protein